MSHETERCIAAGLTPGMLEHLMRGHAGVADIAATYKTDVSVVQMLLRRWGLDHLSGRSKSDVFLVRKVTGGVYG